MQIPIRPIHEVKGEQTVAQYARVFDRLAALFRDVVLRGPPVADAARWIHHEVGGARHRFAQPLTLTPYAAARACSARCRFCSETLRDDNASPVRASSLRPGPGYLSQLRAALACLDGLPLSYSFSGLESTDDPDWLLTLLGTLASLEVGPSIEGSVMYSNGAGFVQHGARLIPALASFGLSCIEWSRHHDREAANQDIMRFRDGQQVAGQATFERTLSKVAHHIPVKMVCVVQRGGIETAGDVLRYLAWAQALGAATVIFREFSGLPSSYRHNTTRRYVDGSRIGMDGLLQACIDDPKFRLSCEPLALTSGYYFWNARWRSKQGGEVVFESSDYGAMLERENSGLIYKLVFHANGHLCSGWQPDRNVLWSPHGRP